MAVGHRNPQTLSGVQRCTCSAAVAPCPHSLPSSRRSERTNYHHYCRRRHGSGGCTRAPSRRSRGQHFQRGLAATGAARQWRLPPLLHPVWRWRLPFLLHVVWRWRSPLLLHTMSDFLAKEGINENRFFGLGDQSSLLGIEQVLHPLHHRSKIPHTNHRVTNGQPQVRNRERPKSLV